ncbi:hypothetical protein DFQ27_009041, partial [Actinomortierella ambigua]
KDGHHLGSIALTNAQIGRQQNQDGGQNDSNFNDPNSYRHAFLILEPKKGTTIVDAKRSNSNVTRHVLCAETDEERDEWVEALIRYIGRDGNGNSNGNSSGNGNVSINTNVNSSNTSAHSGNSSAHSNNNNINGGNGGNSRENSNDGNDDLSRGGRKLPEIQKLGATPIKDLTSSKGNEKLLLNQEAYERQQQPNPSQQGQQQQQRPQQYQPGPSQGRPMQMPQSPTAHPGMDDSIERTSAEGQLNQRYGQRPPNSGEAQMTAPWNQQFQQPFPQQQQGQPSFSRNQSSNSLSHDDPTPSVPDNPSPTSHPTPQEVAERKQKSRMTFHWPKKATKEETSGQGNGSMPMANGQQQQQPAPPPQQDTSRLRNFLGGGKGSSSQNQNGGGNGNGSMNGSTSYASQLPTRQVFGVSLEQAIEQARVYPGYELPAVVYRCIEYLNAHDAKLEEGIYRLNGSSAVIKNLKDRYNHDGDFDLLGSSDYFDIHAVAGLLKLFLRDLPTSVLTRELHKDFLAVIELSGRTDRVIELTRLVSHLPIANYTLLRALTYHLIDIVQNADVNKMTARNVGIVFSPTLGIPAGVFSLMMTDFDQIFNTAEERIMPLENSYQRPKLNLDMPQPPALHQHPPQQYPQDLSQDYDQRHQQQQDQYYQQQQQNSL